MAVLKNNRYIYVNQSWKKQLLRDDTDFTGRSIDEDLLGSEAEAIKTRLNAQGAEEAEEYRFLRSDGSHLVLQLRVVTGVKLAEGDARAYISRDVTERRRLQARLLLADRMMSIGALATGVAHEINNPLSYVLGNLSYLEESLPAWKSGDTSITTKEVIEAVQEAKAGAERVQRIVRDLQAFSRSDQESIVPMDVRKTLEAALNMAWTEIRFRARLRKQFEDVPPVIANEARLGQVFLNLLLNAAHALQEGKADQNVITVSIHPRGNQALVEIQDTGPGIPKELLPVVFDPFFTTKPVGVGTGLGLSIAHSIITDLGGTISVDSVLGEGTTFRVALPVAEELGPDATMDIELDDEPQNSGRILVIDDEPLIANALKRALREHDVTIELSGRGAIDRLQTGAAFDLIFSDLFMPDQTGMDVFRWAKANRPDLVDCFVFMTGGLFSVRVHDFLSEVKNDRIEKPFDLQKIRSLVTKRLR